MRISALFVGGAIALATVLVPIAAPPAHAAPVPVHNAGELKLEFDNASGADNTVELGASFTVAPGDGPIVVPDGVTVTLDMNGESLTVEGPEDYAGIGVYEGSTLEIIDLDDTSTSILKATGGENGAGIGSGWISSPTETTIIPGTISIDGVDEVIAQGGGWAAGIGGGFSAHGGNIQIWDGDITATGGDECGAGIGGGCYAAAGTITIHGGDIDAEGSSGLTGGAGIGGAGNGASGIITIHGGTVDAVGHSVSAGIGGGGAAGGSNAGHITITGGDVTAEGGEAGGSGIGSARGRGHGPIDILGGSVSAVGGCSADYRSGPGIGHAGGASEMTITIDSAEVLATANCLGTTGLAAAVGGGPGSSGADVSITSSSEASEVRLDAPGSPTTIGGGVGAESEFGSLQIGLASEVAIEEDSSLLIPVGSTVSNAGALYMEGPFTNDGTFNNSGVFGAFAGVTNYGHIENNGFLGIDGAGSENGGIISNAGELEFFHTLFNPGIIRGSGAVEGAAFVTGNNFSNVFDLNGAAGGATSNELILAPSFGDAQRAIPTAPTRDGFDFVGWNAASDGSGQMLDGDTVLGTTPTTLTWYAQWQAHQAPATPPAELARTGQSAPTTLLTTGVAVLLMLSGAVAAIVARAHKHV